MIIIMIITIMIIMIIMIIILMKITLYAYIYIYVYIYICLDMSGFPVRFEIPPQTLGERLIRSQLSGWLKPGSSPSAFGGKSVIYR